MKRIAAIIFFSFPVMVAASKSLLESLVHSTVKHYELIPNVTKTNCLFLIKEFPFIMNKNQFKIIREQLEQNAEQLDSCSQKLRQLITYVSESSLFKPLYRETKTILEQIKENERIILSNINALEVKKNQNVATIKAALIRNTENLIAMTTDFIEIFIIIHATRKIKVNDQLFELQELREQQALWSKSMTTIKSSRLELQKKLRKWQHFLIYVSMYAILITIANGIHFYLPELRKKIAKKLTNLVISLKKNYLFEIVSRIPFTKR